MPITEDQIVNIIRANVGRQFPKTCSGCGHRFDSLKEYLHNTIHIGTPHSYDAEMQHWRPIKPIGTFSFSNCMCGTTLSLCSSRMGVVTMWRLLWWARNESSERNVTINELLNSLRTKVDKQVLNEQSDAINH